MKGVRAAKADGRTIDFVAKQLIVCKGRGSELAAKFRKFVRRIRRQRQHEGFLSG